VRYFLPVRPFLSTVAACLACLACASTSSNPGTETTITTRTLSSPGSRVLETTDITGGDQVRVKGSRLDAMSALTQIYGDLQIPIGTMNPDGGQIGNQRLMLPNHRLHGHLLSYYLNCGQESMAGSRADMDEITLSVLSSVTTGKDSVTSVGTLVSGRARPSGTSSNGVDCESTGELEKTIATRLGTILGAPPPVANRD